MNNMKQDDIRELSEREKAREKLPVFYGSYDNFYHGLRELINNGSDELLNHFSSGMIFVILHDDCRTVSVMDTGRGIPINTYANAKLLFETLFASGKYDVTEKTNSGVNGVGNTILQFSSEYFQCTSHLNGKIYQITYENGGEIVQELTCIGDTDKHGTEITFKLDDTCYTETVFDPNEIELIVRRVSMISENITFNYTHKDETKVFNHTLEEYFDKYSVDIIDDSYALPKSNYSRRVEVERKGVKELVEETAEIQVVFGTCVGEEPLQETMLNGNYLKENGTLYDGVIDGFKTYIHKYCKDNNLYKGKGKTVEKNISAQDIENSISFVCRLFNNLVEFESQVKFSTKKEYYKQVAKEYIQSKLEVYKLENDKEFKRLVDQVLICKRANDVNIKARQELKDKLTKKANKNGMSIRIEGLKDCNMRKSELYERILLLTEGLSASSTVEDSFDGRYMGCYGLKGRFINALKSSIKDVLNNEPALGVINALGCGIEIPKEELKNFKDMVTFNNEESRYNIVGILCDADAFGKGIALSLVSFFWKYMPELLKNNRICIVISPRYEIYLKGDKVEYAYNESEKEAFIEQYGNKISHIGIIKGLGEMNADAFWDYVLCPEAREKTFINIDYNEDMEVVIAETFNRLMGKDIEGRKQFIKDNITNVNLDEVE